MKKNSDYNSQLSFSSNIAQSSSLIFLDLTHTMKDRIKKTSLHLTFSWKLLCLFQKNVNFFDVKSLLEQKVVSTENGLSCADKKTNKTPNSSHLLIL